MTPRWRGSQIVWLAGVVYFTFLSFAAAVEPVTGFRGDGTGKYPAANPPTAWSRISEAMKGVRFSAEKAQSADDGIAMPDGVAREWLIAGPFPLVQKGDSAEFAALPDEAALEPVAGQEAGKRHWQKVVLDTAYLDFNHLLGKVDNQQTAAFAFTRIYSPAGGKYRLNLTAVNQVQIWLNGKKPASMGARMTLELSKGWNRILLRVSPGEKDWYAVPVLHAQGHAEYVESGIAWKLTLPGITPAFYGGGMGAGSPIIVGEKMILLSEPHDVVCLDRKTGAVQWVRRASYFEAATDDEKTQPAYADAKAIAEKIDAINSSFISGKATEAQLLEKGKLEADLRKGMKQVNRKRYANENVPDTGFSGYTPCSDGKLIYVWFGDGVSACFDLEGNRKWIRVDQHPAVEHGFSSSPVLVDGKFVFYMRHVIAVQCETGATAWDIPLVSETGDNPGGSFYGSLAATSIGGVKVVLLANGTILRVSDGSVLWKEPTINNSSVPTPVVEGNITLHTTRGNDGLIIRTLPEQLTEPFNPSLQMMTLDVTAFPKHYLPWHLSSPVVDQGLIYFVNNAGVLTVIDLPAAKIVYQKMLDLDVFQAHNEGAFRGVGASLILAGKHLYVIGNNGASIVFEPGRVYKQVAKNKLESIVMLDHWAERQERFIANPIADGDRLIIRGEQNLYAIGPK